MIKDLHNLLYISHKYAKSPKIIVGVLLSFFVFSTQIFAQNPLAVAQDINVLVENNASFTGGDVEGAIFAGGNFTINGYAQITGNNSGSGNTYRNIDGANYKIVAHGSIIYNNALFNVNGQTTEKFVKFGNLNGGTVSFSGQNVSILNAGKGFQINSTSQTSGFSGTSSFNFAAAFATLRANSTGFSTCTANISPTIASNTFLTLGASGRQVWNITAAQLSTISTVTFQNQPTASNPLIVNVNAAGAYVWNVPTMAGIGRTNGAQYIIWNFYNATSLTIQGNGMCEGSILAPNANIIKSNTNNIEGQVIGMSLTQTISGGEFHVAHFNASSNASPCSTCSNVTSAGTIGSNQTVCSANYNPNILTEASAPAGGSGALEYQWQSSSDNSSWADISGATAQTYDPPNITATTYYRRGVRRAGCSAYVYSGSVSVILNAIPAAPTSTGANRCGTGTLAMTASGCAGGTISWFAASAGGTVLVTGTNYTTPSISATTTYYLECTVNGCASATRNSVVATVNGTPTPPTSAGANRCGTGTLAMTASGCAGGTISWFAAAAGGTVLVTGTNYTTPSISTTATYYLECTQNSCVSATRNAVTATVNTIPTPTATGDTKCVGSTLSLNSTGGGTYSWTGPSGFTNNIQNPTIANAQTTHAGIYTVTVTGTGGCTATATANVVVNTIPAAPTSAGANRCGTGTLAMTASGCAGGTISCLPPPQVVLPWQQEQIIPHQVFRQQLLII